MSDDTYEGWANRETWAVNLHLNNSEHLHELATQVVSDAIAGRTIWVERLHSNPAFAVGDSLQSLVMSIIEPVFHDNAGWVSPDIRMMASDIGSMWRVNWDEIGEAWAAAHEEEQEEEE